MTDLKALRHILHQAPELSHQETATFEIIRNQFEAFGFDELIDFDKGGKGFLFEGTHAGALSVFRAELDALPIQEQSSLSYASKNRGVSHVCGHDGHMTILTGLGERVGKNRPQAGSCLLLFQSAEETGTGAEIVSKHSAFNNLKPNHIFGLHNIPGLPLHQITARKGVFSAASTGMIIRLRGKTSHAAEPENGINPDRAVAQFVQDVHLMNEAFKHKEEVTFGTIVQIKLGEEAFGTSAGEADVLLTLRSLEKDGLEEMKNLLIQSIIDIARDCRLDLEYSFREEFPPTLNSEAELALLKNAASENKFSFEELEQPFRWSEDFGYFTRNIPGCFFGLGSGIEQPALHNPDFDFPDELIDTGVAIFYSIYKKLHLNYK